MRQHIDAGFKKLPEISGELTAAALLIPVSLAFQDFAHALVQDPHVFGGSFVAFAYLQLAAFIVLSLIAVIVLSMAMLLIAQFDPSRKVLLVVCLLAYVMMIAISGAMADQKESGEMIRSILVASALPVLVVAIFLLDWNQTQKHDWQLMANFLVILSIVLLVSPV